MAAGVLFLARLLPFALQPGAPFERHVSCGGAMARLARDAQLCHAAVEAIPREVMPTLGNAADAEVLLPLPLGPKAPQVRSGEDYNILGRVKPGVTVAQVQQDLVDECVRRQRGELARERLDDDRIGTRLCEKLGAATERAHHRRGEHARAARRLRAAARRARWRERSRRRTRRTQPSSRG